MATEAVRTKSPVIELGDSLSTFLRDVIDVGDQRGTRTRVAEQIKRLFGSLVTAQRTGDMQNRGFVLRAGFSEGTQLDRQHESSR